MKLSNLIIVFMGIMVCFLFVVFINVDITQKAEQNNTEYASKLSSACLDASASMRTENIEKYGCVWNDADDLNKTLSVFYNSLAYSMNWDNQGREKELALYTPIVCLVDINGYYISHNVVFDTTGNVSISSDAEKTNSLTSINTWTKNYGGSILRFFLNNTVEVICTDGEVFKGPRQKVYNDICDKKPGSAEIGNLFFLKDDDEFNKQKNELIVREINKQCEYYINKHNLIGERTDARYTYEMPEIRGEDWNRLLENPTVIAFLQGYSTQSDNKLLNLYSLAGGELTLRYHYFISGDEYHCLELESGVTKGENIDSITYESNGVTKTKKTRYIVYTWNGEEITEIYDNQSDCAKQGKVPCDCVYTLNR